MDVRVDPRRTAGAWRGAAVALMTCLAAGCAQATNYLGPLEPRYEQALAPPVAPAACAGRTGAFTVVTFNVQYAKKVDLAIDVLRSTPALRDADVLLLQEMDPPGVERIAAALAMNAVFLPSGWHPSTRRDFGPAVLSRWPIEGGRRIVLPHRALRTGLATTVTAATVRCGAIRVGVMSVHLPSPGGASDDERRDQIEVLLASAASIDGPLVIGGDFNAGWIGPLFEKAGFTWVNKDQPGTRSFLGIGLKLDHVFVRGLRPRGGGPAAGVADARGASDHKPLWARLELHTLPGRPNAQR